MTIYFSHSKSFDYKKELYEPLRNSELAKHHCFIFPHDESDNPYGTKELFQSKNCDLVVAEVSFPATGQGIELGWAEMLQIPIVCLYKKDAKVASSLRIISSKFIEYKDSESMIEDLTKLLR
ncbi:MAG TPA: hypothetical protein VMR41_05080 [Patescibacteria group bacterium]|nr:hypothetical protein [Patescibacteria group bacterium]